MPTPPPDPRDDEVAQIDWEAVRASARRRLRARMGGFTREDVEDAAQDVVERYVRFIHRNGLPRTSEGFLFELVRRVAANNVARRQRERAMESKDTPTWVRPPDSALDEDDVLAQYAIIVFHVQEYFRLKKAGCVTLADAKSRGESLKQHAAKRALSYAKIRQDWARCVKLIHEAMRSKRLRLTWPTPRPRRRAGG